MPDSPSTFIAELVQIARAAGEAIMAVRAEAGDALTVQEKADGSPLSEADRRAHSIIAEGLRQLAPDVPLLSEESPAEEVAMRQGWRRYWLVDPLDGTKGFLRGRPYFSVNIALMEGAAGAAKAVLGVVHAPVDGVTYYAEDGAAYRLDGNAGLHRVGRPRRIHTRKLRRDDVLMLSSSRHGRHSGQLRARLEAAGCKVQTVAFGSSLKICQVAEGAADVYPRFAPTSEWDTAAAECVLEAAGGRLTDLAGAPLQYNKPSLLNPSFLAVGDVAAMDWRDMVLTPP